MATKKISALPEKLNPVGTDILPIVDAADPNNLVTKKTTLSALQRHLIAENQKGVPGGVASLDPITGKIPADQLPDLGGLGGEIGATGPQGPPGPPAVISAADVDAFPVTGVEDSFYLALNTNRLYVWRDNTYVEIGTGGSSPSIFEYAAAELFPPLGQSGILYIDAATNRIYRWMTSFYVEVGGGGGQQIFEYAAAELFPPLGQSGILYIDAATNRIYRWMTSFYVEVGGNF
jgi:hypothetical protein